MKQSMKKTRLTRMERKTIAVFSGDRLILVTRRRKKKVITPKSNMDQELRPKME